MPKPDREPLLGPGEVLAGRFRVVGIVGQGGMGQVYEARDLELGEAIALKILHPEAARRPRLADRFRREAALARRVTHPNVCRVYDFRRHYPEVHAGPSEPFMFLVMELLAGETLASYVRETGPMSPEEILPWVRQLADGLDAAHSEGVVHRDFKGANVILHRSAAGQRAVITDFGLASGPSAPETVGPTITDRSLLVGSPWYMAPEQVLGEKAGPEADIYALGVVIYEMLTGNTPFDGKTPIEVAARRLSHRPPSPRWRSPNLPLAWESAVMRCLELRAEDRFSSAGDLVEALEYRVA